VSRDDGRPPREVRTVGCTLPCDEVCTPLVPLSSLTRLGGLLNDSTRVAACVF
jgi:hypothetical protein